MTLKSGWCLDEIQARDLDQHERARRLHRQCSREHCTCEHHESEGAEQ